MTTLTNYPMNWQCAHGGPAGNGTLRARPEYFVVDEILGCEPDCEGEHDMLRIEKTGTNTEWLARQLARHAGIAARDVGFSGMKDRHAVTTQWFSVRRPSGSGTDWDAFDAPGCRLIEQSRNLRKLRRGAHSANNFKIIISDLQAKPDVLNDRLERALASGVPNYFGEQRFGHGGRNIDLALSLFAGKRLARDKRSIAISAARSWLFNQALSARVVAGTWDQPLLPGPLMLDGTNSYFEGEQGDESLASRLQQLDVHPALPLPGGDEANDGGEAGEPDYAVALRTGLATHAKQGMRAARLAVRNLDWSIGDDRLEMSFQLVAGGFATAVIRELVTTTQASVSSNT